MYFGSGLLLDILFANIFSLSVGCLFTFKIVSFDAQILIKSYLFFFSFVACTFGGIFKKPLLNPSSWRFTSMFPSKSFIFLAPTFRCLIHFGLCFWYGMKCKSKFILFHVAIQCPSTTCDCLLCVCVCDCLLN